MLPTPLWHLNISIITPLQWVYLSSSSLSFHCPLPVSLHPFSFSCCVSHFTLFSLASAHCAASLVCFIGGVCISRATQVVNLLLIPQTKLHFFAALVVVAVGGGGGASAVASVTHHFVKYCCFAYLQQQQRRRLSSALLQLLELNSVLSETRFQSTWRTTATMLAPQT